MLNNKCRGKDSPATKHKECFAKMIMILSQHRHSITSSEGLELINNLIRGTEIEKEIKY